MSTFKKEMGKTTWKQYFKDLNDGGEQDDADVDPIFKTCKTYSSHLTEELRTLKKKVFKQFIKEIETFQNRRKNANPKFFYSNVDNHDEKMEEYHDEMQYDNYDGDNEIDEVYRMRERLRSNLDGPYWSKEEEAHPVRHHNLRSYHTTHHQ